MSTTYKEYSLRGYAPYEPGEYLYSGDEEGLKEFIKRFAQYTTHNKDGKAYSKPVPYKIAGYYLDNLEVLILGPDVRTYLE